MYTKLVQLTLTLALDIFELACSVADIDRFRHLCFAEVFHQRLIASRRVAVFCVISYDLFVELLNECNVLLWTSEWRVWSSPWNRHLTQCTICMNQNWCFKLYLIFIIEATYYCVANYNACCDITSTNVQTENCTYVMLHSLGYYRQCGKTVMTEAL